LNNSKIVSTTKTTSAIFLAIVLVTGTIALYSPSFLITPANAQTEPPYYEAYDYTGYGDDYKQQSIYSYDNNYKSKDSDFIKKIKCNNNNININGENTGDINLGNDGQGSAAAGEGYLSAGSSGGSGYDREGYNKKGFDCVTNSNNNSNNNEGLQGPVGPRGPQGPEGPPGLTGPFYQVFGADTLHNSSTQGVAEVSCDAGDIAISGSAVHLSNFGLVDIEDFRDPTNASKWIARQNVAPPDDIAPALVQAIAICLDNPPLRP
jgi:hypothetical protein